MQEEIKNWLQSHNILPRISFKDRKEHIIEMVKAKSESFTNNDGELVEGIKFLVREDGEPKTFFTASQDLLLKLVECQEGEIYKVKMIARNVAGRIKTSYDVKKLDGDKEVDVENPDDIPVINEEENTEPTKEELDEMFPKDER